MLRESSLSSLVGKKIRLKMTELNQRFGHVCDVPGVASRSVRISVGEVGILRVRVREIAGSRWSSSRYYIEFPNGRYVAVADTRDDNGHLSVSGEPIFCSNFDVDRWTSIKVT